MSIPADIQPSSLHLIDVSKVNAAGLPFKASTFFKWHHLGKYPEIFIKFSGRLFVDLDALEKVMRQGQKGVK